MMHLLITLVISIFVPFVLFQFINLSRNLRNAKSSGFKCVILPVYLFSVPSWVVTRAFLLPVMRLLPASWTETWLPLLGIEHIWHHGYEPFERMGTDTFMAVSPMGNILFTNEPEASSQLLAGRVFEKPAMKIMPMLNIYGPTITGTDGAEARLYRKIAAPFFTTQRMKQVWSESILCVEKWMRHLELNKDTDPDLRPTLGFFNLHVISKVGFGSDMGNFDPPSEARAPDDRALSFSQAMLSFINHFMTVFLTPKFILKNSPFPSHRNALKSYEELLHYMTELRDSKVMQRRLQKAEKMKPESERNLLDLIIEAGEPSEKDQAPVLFPDAVMGNIFILLFAGHEANVNTLHFAIILLACYPSILKAMQADIDRITSGEQSADEAVSWNYEDKYRSLTNSLVGAVMNETLRLYSVVPVLTKTTLENPQSIILNGATHVIPSNTIILVNKSATHRNPKFWPPSRKSSRAGNPSALGDFDPYQWIVRDDDGSQGLFRPVPGSFLGFGEGSRGCLGKSFGQTELCAFLARLFKDYSVELAVDDLLIGDTDDVKRVKWKARRDEAEREMSDSVQFHMSLRLTGKVPVRFVKRGQETFAHLGH